MEPIYPSNRTIRLDQHQLHARSFLLGNEAGFVVHQPVELNVAERTLVPIKWFGASEFGRTYLEAVRVWLERGSNRLLLNRSNQVAFEQDLSEVVRIFEVDGTVARQRFFVPDHCPSLVMTLECDRPARFVLEPQFDMRYYQGFNTDFSGYAVEVLDSPDGPTLSVHNHIDAPDAGEMNFSSVIRTRGGRMQVELLPPDARLQKRTYLKDEQREKVIHRAYAETHVQSPDEAPIWDSYTNTVYVPARLSTEGPATFVFSFDEDRVDAERVSTHVVDSLTDLYRKDESAAVQVLERALLQTGNGEVDLAYNQILTRFNAALVARDLTIRTESHQVEHLTAIFAGDKYFLDAWKRDENISLEALILANDFETVRAILSNTWQYQDKRTGRLPHIIRVGQPLVYYSSDGTLWALRRLGQYTRVSGDQSLLDEKYGMVAHFFEASLGSVRRGLLPSGGMIQRSYLWETWEDTAYTCRDGYPVEIESLWLAALQDFLPEVAQRNPDLAERMEATLAEGRSTFARFYLDGYLADSLDYAFRPRELFTANAFLAVATGQPVPGELARQMVHLARTELAGRVGVKSLAPKDWPKVFSPDFLADPKNIHNGNMASIGIYNYHRGIEWLWLNQFLLLGELCYGSTDIGYHRYVEGQVRSALEASGVAGLDELNDLHGPLGADFQAWSMASFIGCLHHFAGVEIDAVQRRISVRPCLPSAWPDLLTRRRVANHSFDVRMRVGGDGCRLLLMECLGSPPPDYELKAGIRISPGEEFRSIQVNGSEMDRDQWDVRHPSGPGGPAELWVKTRFERTVTVEFRPA